jgi:RecJ-like exonuclease
MIIKYNNHKCIDCNKQLKNFYAIRCVKCESKRKSLAYRGKNNPNYKQGWYSKIKYCKGCNKKLSDNKVLLCKSCAKKGKRNNMYNIKGRVNVQANTIIKHHVDLDKKNNKKINILRVKHNVHMSLHHRAYRYLVEKGMIKLYIKWFKHRYGLKHYDKIKV